MKGMRKFADMKNISEKYKRRIAEKDALLSSQKTQILKSKREMDFMRPFFLQKVHEHYLEVTEKLKEKVKNGGKIRVAFFVMYESIFPGKLLFEAMQKDPLFEPFIVVINLYTDYYSYSMGQILTNYERAYSILSKKYSDKYVLRSYEPDTNTYKDFGSDFDIVFTESFYMHISHPFYLVSNFLHHDVLTANINYGYIIAQHTMYAIEAIPYSSFWAVFAENNMFKDDASRYESVKGRNIVVSGSVRMDELALCENNVNDKKRKTIMIAPHHASVINVAKNKDANFFRYADFWLRLPKMYPEIDFIYRPHPFAMDSFSVHKGWSIERVNDYINTLKSYPNVVYSGSGDHMALFAETDGIIHDCGSFLTEYLFTGKPACYILDKEDMRHLEKYFNIPGRECLKHYYKAFSEKDMIKFIENVVVKGKDNMLGNRIDFVNKELKINYPHATEAVIDFIKKELGAL